MSGKVDTEQRLSSSPALQPRLSLMSQVARSGVCVARSVGDPAAQERSAAIEALAKRTGAQIVEWFYEPAVSGAEPIGGASRLWPFIGSATAFSVG